MRQQIYNIFLLLGMVLLLASCVHDPLFPNGEEDSDGDSTGGGNFSIRLGMPTTEPEVMRENMIDGVRIVLYGGDDKVVYCEDLDIKLEYDTDEGCLKASGDDDLKGTIVTQNYYLIQTNARKINSGEYDMLIIVNPNQDIKDITDVGVAKSALNHFELKDTSLHGTWEGTQKEDGTQDIAGGPAYFLMLNSQGFVPLTPADFRTTKELAEDNPVYASVERVAAKVTCNFTGFKNANNTRSTSVAPYGRFVMLMDYNNQQSAPWGMDYDIPEDCTTCPVCGADFNLATKACTVHAHHTYDGLGLVADRVRYMVATDLTWQIDIVNKKSHWMRHLANKKGNTDMEVRGDVDRENFYAEDPNYTRPTNLSDEFTYVPGTARKLFPATVNDYKYSNYWSWEAADAAADATPLYIPENTMATGEQKHDVVTRVLFKATLKREQFTDKDTNEDPKDVKTIGDFFVFKGGNAANENYKYNNYNKDGSIFYILRPEDVAIYAAAANTDGIHIYLRTGMLDAIKDFKTKNPNFDWSNIGSNDPAMGKDLIFYKDGVMYYEVPIEHFATMTGNGPDYGCFGVVRNNWYKLNVESIISLGQPTIPAATNTTITKTSGSVASGGSGSTRSAEDAGGLFRRQSIIF